MNLRSFLTSLFRGYALNGELEQVRESARQDAQLVVGTYVNEFQAETARLLLETQQRFLTHHDDDSIEAEYERLPEPEPTPTKKPATRRK